MYHAHSKNNGGFWETVSAHLRETATLSARFASAWDREEEEYEIFGSRRAV